MTLSSVTTFLRLVYPFFSLHSYSPTQGLFAVRIASLIRESFAKKPAQDRPSGVPLNVHRTLSGRTTGFFLLHAITK